MGTHEELNKVKLFKQLVHVVAELEQVSHWLTQPVQVPKEGLGYSPVGQVVLHVLVLTIK